MVFQPQSAVYAAAVLTVEPITWNVIGLDSNNVNVGPNNFPIGVRVCNTGDTTATNVTAKFVWDSSNTYINNRPGTNTTLSVSSLAPGGCNVAYHDFYFEVEVTRNSAAYDTTRDYHIEVTADGGLSVSTLMPRELYVEHLVSQNRNAVTDVQYGTSLASLTSVAAGGTMTLAVGGTYYIRLVGYTATQGYEQLESFINIPNTIFQVNSVSTTYSADTSSYVSNPNDKAYGNACNWENDPNSPNYRACLSTGKVGGNITVTYQVTILKVPAAPLVNPQPLSTLIYDFSGSSYHYNADFGVSTRYAYIVSASLAKSFSPKTILAGGTSTLSFTITNPSTSSVSDFNFTDTLPSGVTLANTTVSYSGCGTSPSPSTLTVNGPPQSLSFSNITVAGSGTCTISITVTSSTNGTYNNTTGNLFIGTTDTGNSASDTLTVSSQPAPPTSCASPTTIATWDFSNYTASASPNTADFNASSTVLGSGNAVSHYGAGTGSTSGIANTTTTPLSFTPDATGNSGNSWGIGGGWPASTAVPTGSTTPYFQFKVVTGGTYGGVSITSRYNADGNWSATHEWFVLYSTDGINWTSGGTGTLSLASSWQTGIAATTTNTNTVYFRIIGVGAQYSGPGAGTTTATMFLDDVTISGCPLPTVPNLSKSFSPTSIGTGSTSTLTFTLTNPNATALTGVGFSDALPTGLLIATPNGLAQSCSPGTSFTGATISAPAGTSTIMVSGGTLSANASCTISISVLGDSAGSYTNISTSIISTETGPNTTSSGYGTSSLTVIDPPVIAKSFTANPIFTGNTTTLNFNIVNPNASTILTGVAFTDVLPAGLSVANGTFSVCGGTNNLTTTAATGTIALLNTTTIAGGGACSFSVTVTGSTAGSYTNTTSNITSTNGGTGNTATANVLVKTPAPAINLLKQVGSSASGPWSSFLTATVGDPVYYKFYIENTGDILLDPVTVDDPDSVVGPLLAGCTWYHATYGPAPAYIYLGDAAITPPLQLPAAAAGVDPSAYCIVGPIPGGALSGSHTNTATATGTGGTMTTDSSSATYGTPALTLVKSVTQTSFTSAGETLNYSYLVTNSGFAPLLGPVTVTDDKASVTCPAVTTVGDLDTWFDVGESITCTATYTITGGVGGDIDNGSVTNTASATVSGVTSNTDSETVYRIPDFTVSKTNDVSGSVPQNGTFNWTITVSQISTGQGTFANAQIILSDTLPGVDGYYTLAPLTVMPGATAPTGTINCSIVSGPSLSCVASGAVTFPSGASFSVTFAVTPTAAGSLANTATVDPGGSLTELNEANNSSSDTVTVVAPPSISKNFAPDPIFVNGISTLTFTITNPNTSSTLSGVGFNDPLPLGLQVAAPPNASTSAGCGSPTFAPVATDTTLTFSGGTIPASGTCTVAVDVTATTDGLKNNTTGNVTSTNGGTGNTANDTLTVNPLADLVITKTDGVTSVNAGGTTTYTIRVTNNGPSTATGVILSDPAVTGLSKTGVSCSATPGQCVTAPTIAQLEGGAFALPALASGQFYEIAVTVDVTATNGNVTNTATVTTPAGTTDPTPGNNSASDSNTVNPIADLAITKTDGVASVNAGGTTTYTIRVTNNGPSIVTGATLTDPVATGLSKTTVACSATPGECVTVPTVAELESGTLILPDLISGAFYEITVTANVTATSGSVTNTANVTPPAGTTDPTPGNNTVSDTDTINSVADLSITKTDGSAIYVPGVGVTYTVTVTNGGPSDVIGATVADTKPTQITTWAWACASQTGGATGCTPAASSSSDFSDSVDIPSGGSIVYTVTANIAPAATGNLVNTATVSVPAGTTDPTPGNNSATDTDTPNPQADLSVTKTDGVVTYTPGGTTTYTIVVSNAGPSDVIGATFTDTFPAAITNASWTCAGSGGGTCTASGTGDINDNVDIPVGGSVTYTITATIRASATGTLVNTATITPPVGTTDPNPGNNSATDTDTPNLQADLSVTKTDGVTTYTPGGNTTYTIIVSNSGPSAVIGATFIDTFPVEITSASWTCVGGGGGTCTASGTGNINDSLDLPVGGSVTYTVTATINASATGNLTNTATITPPVGTTDPTPGNNTATDTDTSNAAADLSVTKTDGSTIYTAGTPITYTITVSNVGGISAAGTVTDTFPASLTSITWSCAGTGGATCGSSGSGDINDNVSIPAGESVTYTVNATVISNTTGNLINTATATLSSGIDPTPGDNSSTDTDTPNPQADLSVTKTDGVATYTPGGTTTYTIVVSNAGPSAVTAGTFTDTFPAAITSASWTCAGSGGGTCTASGTGNINDSVDLPVGGSVTYTVVATISASATGSLTNTATITAPAGITDPNPVNNSATDTDTVALVADPALSKAGNPTQATVGETVTFTLTATNAGNIPAPNVVITDTLPAQFDVVTVTSVYQAGGNAGTISVSSAPAPYTVTVNLGTLNVTDVVTITITTTVNSLGNPPINNTANVSTSATSDVAANNADSVTMTLRASNPSSGSNRPTLLPATGFAPDVETKLPAQLHNMMYAATDVMLEIPSLGLKLPIVGVPKKNGTWDVSWLGKQAGWLAGSAFPSWSGNSVLTSHVYASNGLPGPFVNLNRLKYGDQIIVHAYGQKYIFEIQTNQVVAPNDTSAFKHEEKPWLTLITCKEYDEKTNSYQKRVVVRAVLVKVEWDK
jgi:LPXTG-site transpeptidase (sortase) family protein